MKYWFIFLTLIVASTTCWNVFSATSANSVSSSAFLQQENCNESSGFAAGIENPENAEVSELHEINRTLSRLITDNNSEFYNYEISFALDFNQQIFITEKIYFDQRICPSLYFTSRLRL